MDKEEVKKEAPEDILAGVEVVIEPDTADEEPQRPAPKKDAAEESQGRRDDDDDDDGDEDRRAKSGGADDDDEGLTPEQKAKRERNREERRLRKQRREEAQRELEFLRRRVDELEGRHEETERRMTVGEYQRLRSAAETAVAQMQEAQRLRDEAKKAQDWAAHADALEAFHEARERATYFDSQLRRFGPQDDGGEQRGGAQRPPQHHPETVRRAKAWRSQNSWFDPEGSDPDSRVATRIDRQLTNDGYDPKTPEFWEELDKRLAKSLPHRVKAKEAADDLDEERDSRRSPTSGSGRERAAGSAAGGKEVFRLSAARVAAMKEDGSWFDPAAKARKIKYFMEWDKKNAHLVNQGKGR